MVSYEQECIRCKARNVALAKFCGRCGLSLQSGRDGRLESGRIYSPNAITPPDGFLPCTMAEHLSYRWGSAWGGSFLVGTEGIAVSIFNGAYPLQDVRLKIRGYDAHGQEQVSIEPLIEHLPAGKETPVDIPSYEVTDPIQRLTVELVDAEFEELY